MYYVGSTYLFMSSGPANDSNNVTLFPGLTLVNKCLKPSPPNQGLPFPLLLRSVVQSLNRQLRRTEWGCLRPVPPVLAQGKILLLQPAISAFCASSWVPPSHILTAAQTRGLCWDSMVRMLGQTLHLSLKKTPCGLGGRNECPSEPLLAREPPIDIAGCHRLPLSCPPWGPGPRHPLHRHWWEWGLSPQLTPPLGLCSWRDTLDRSRWQGELLSTEKCVLSQATPHPVSNSQPLTTALESHHSCMAWGYCYSYSDSEMRKLRSREVK